MSVRRVVFFFALFALSAFAQERKQLTVAAASDMSFAMKEIAALYQAKHKTQVRLVFGSSGNLYHQIRNGSPVDVFLSADELLPQKLAEDGFGKIESVRRYAVGSLVLWVPASSPLNVTRLGEKALLDPRVKRIAIANPQHAPYGRATEEALRSLKMWEGVQSKLVLGENVSQTTQFAQSGNAEIGVISLSYALSNALTGGKFWRVPASLHAPIQQGLIVVDRKAGDVSEARRFADFLYSAEAREVLTRYGFQIPETSASAKSGTKR